MTKLEQAFVDMVDNCGIKGGDTVKVVCKSPQDHMGWSAMWPKEMDRTVGRTGKVEYICQNKLSGFRVKVGPLSYSYPPFCLLKIKDAPKVKKSSLKGKTVKVELDGVTYTATIN